MRSARLAAAIAVSAAALMALAACSSGPGRPAASPFASASQAPTSQAPTASASSTASPVSPSGTSATHQPSSVPAGFQPASVTFVSPDVGFVLGVVPCAAGHCSALVATTDGGHTWTLVGPVPAAFGDAGVRRVRFADAHDGWVFDPQLWATHDGGQTWREVPAPTRVADVEAWGGRAYAVMDPHLLRTSTGADAWSPVPGVDLGEGANSIVLHGSAAWIVTGGRTMVMTTDGTTWRTVATPCGSLAGGWTLAAVAPVDATDVDLLCVGNAGLGSESKQVLLSKDAGRHATPTSADPPRSGGANGIAAASPDVVVIAARSGASYLYRSADAGASWQVGVQHGDGGVGFFDLGFTTSTQGVAVYGQPDVVTHTQLLMTRDAGASWAPVSF